jgi:phage terminase large subunit-like protein
MPNGTPALDLPDPNEHIPYRVLSQMPRQELVGNRFNDVMEVEYEGPSGTVDRITIAQREYEPAAVDRAIQERLHSVEGVHALGPAPHPENLAGPGIPEA